MMMKKLLVLLVMLLASTVLGQTSTLQWYDNTAGFTKAAATDKHPTLYFNITKEPESGVNGEVSLVRELSTKTISTYYTTAPTGAFTIPATVSNNENTYTVTSIGDFAFDGCSGLTGSLSIPNSVTRAFQGCSGFDLSLTIGTAVTSIGY